MDNLGDYISAVGAEYDIPIFTEVIAEACKIKYDFYDFKVANKTEITNLGAYEQIVNINIGAVNITKIKDNRSITEFGIIAQYNPEKVTQITPADIL